MIENASYEMCHGGRTHPWVVFCVEGPPAHLTWEVPRDPPVLQTPVMRNRPSNPIAENKKIWGQLQMELKQSCCSWSEFHCSACADVCIDGIAIRTQSDEGRYSERTCKNLRVWWLRAAHVDELRRVPKTSQRATFYCGDDSMEIGTKIGCRLDQFSSRSPCAVCIRIQCHSHTCAMFHKYHMKSIDASPSWGLRNS